MGEEAFEEFVVLDGLFLVVAPDACARDHITVHFFLLSFRCSLCVSVHLAILVHAGFCQFRFKVIGVCGFGGLLLLLFLEGCGVELAIGGGCGFVAAVCCLVLGLFRGFLFLA